MRRNITRLTIIASPFAGLACSDNGKSAAQPEPDASAIFDAASTEAASQSTETASPLDPTWACLAHLVAPTTLPTANPRSAITYLVPIVDFDSQPSSPAPIPDLTVKVCSNAACDPTTQTVAVAPFPRAPPYMFEVAVPYGYENLYLQIAAPGYVPTDYVLGGPLVGPPEGGDTVMGLPIPLVTVETFDVLYGDLRLSTPPDPERGILAVRTLNCVRDITSGLPRATRAAGVVLQMLSDPDVDSVPFSLSFNNIVTPNSNKTDARGVVGFANLQSGAYAVQGIAPTASASGTPYGNTTLRIRPGVITIAEIRDGIGVWGQ